MTDIHDLQAQSVTAGDEKFIGGVTPNGAVWYFSVPLEGGSDASQLMPITPFPYWVRERDAQLRTTTIQESIWADAIYKVATRLASYGWNIKDVARSARRVKRSQSLLHGADFGAGWVQFILKVIKDFTCTDNGAFVEVIRKTNARGSRVMGIKHLDSLRCWRTGDPTYPVAYSDLSGRFHLMRDYQVIDLVDMPSSDPRLRGIGYCAASRAWPAIVKLQYLDRYITEKLCGKAQAIYFVNGITAEQLKSAVAQGQAQAVAQNFVKYMGAIVMTTARPEAPQVSSIDLAGLPDRVNAEEERYHCLLQISHALGVFIGELKPLAGQYGTGTQSTLLSDIAAEQGLGTFVGQWEHKISRDVLPTTTTFAYSAKSYREQKVAAEVSKLRVETRKIQLEIGELDAQQGKQMAADFGDIDRSFVADSEILDDSLSDDEKPIPVGADDVVADEDTGVDDIDVGQYFGIEAKAKKTRKKSNAAAAEALVGMELKRATELVKTLRAA